MKNTLKLAALILFFGGSQLMAGDVFNVPSARNANPVPSADYGGYYMSTLRFSSGPVFVSSGEVVVAGITEELDGLDLLGRNRARE